MMTDLLMGCPRTKSFHRSLSPTSVPWTLGTFLSLSFLSPESEHASLQIPQHPRVESELLSRSLSGLLLSIGEIIMLGSQPVCPAATD